MSTPTGATQGFSKGTVMLPCAPEDFRDFISGILGKPQTIERLVPGPFVLTRDAVRDLYVLLEQRVLSQNDGALMQFTARISYDDNSSVLLNSIEDFMSYNEVKPLISSNLVLNWVFLLKFRNKSAPEKQSIDIAFSSNEGVSFAPPMGPLNESVISVFTNGISVRISHTDRTWGSDIDSLLNGALEKLSEEKSKLREFFNKNSGWFGLAAFSLCMSISVWGIVESAQRIEAWHHHRMSDLGTAPTDSMLLSYISQSIAQGAWTRFGLYGAFFVVFALVASIGFGVTITNLAGKRQTSSILLTEKSKSHFEKSKTSLRNNWIKLAFTALASGFIGAAGKQIFIWVTHFS